jgi:hypothetical protein
LVSVRQQLDAWVEQGWLRSLDRAFALFLAAEVPAIDPLALLAAALVSYQLGRGHVCLHMGHLVDNPLRTLGLPEAGSQPCKHLGSHFGGQSCKHSGRRFDGQPRKHPSEEPGTRACQLSYQLSY